MSLQGIAILTGWEEEEEEEGVGAGGGVATGGGDGDGGAGVGAVGGGGGNNANFVNGPFADNNLDMRECGHCEKMEEYFGDFEVCR